MSVDTSSVADGCSLAATTKFRLRPAGFAWAALSISIFSGWFVVTRFGMTHELRIWDIMALRFGGGTLVLLPFLIGNRSRLPRRAWLEGLLFALLWGAPFVFLVGRGLQLTSATEASAITPALMPVFAGFIAWRALGEQPGWSRLFAYVVIVASLIVLVASGGQLRDWASAGGIGMLIAAASTWAIYTLRFRASGLSPQQATALICFWSAAFFLPIYLLFGLSHLGQASIQELTFQVIYQGVLMSVVAIVAYNRAITLLGAGAAAAMTALLPVIVSALAVFVLGEVPSWPEASAIAFISAGVILAVRLAPSSDVSSDYLPAARSSP